MPGISNTDELRLPGALTLSKFVPLLKYISLTLIILALARPMLGTGKLITQREGINILFAMDISESMGASDFTLNGQSISRIDAVKHVMASFISNRKEDNVGLVLFGTNAFTGVPLTHDYKSFTQILDKINIGLAGKRTAIGDAIGISLKRLSASEKKTSIIILMTDGQHNSGTLSTESASAIASKMNVKIYTIGVGTKGDVPFTIHDPFFGKQVIQKKTDIDESGLKRIAQLTGGNYYNAGNADTLKSIYKEIDALEKTETLTETIATYKDLYPYFLAASILFLFSYITLSNTIFLRVP